MAKKKSANRLPKLSQTEQDLLSHIEDGYQLETDSLGGNPVLRRLKNNEETRPLSASRNTIKALERRGLIIPGKGRNPLNEAASPRTWRWHEFMFSLRCSILTMCPVLLITGGKSKSSEAGSVRSPSEDSMLNALSRLSGHNSGHSAENVIYHRIRRIAAKHSWP